MAATSKVCQQCKEKNNPSFSACWKCGAPFEQEKKATTPTTRKPAPTKDHRLIYNTPLKPKVCPPIFKYASSPFCILGLSTGCTSPEVSGRVNEVKIYAKLGSFPKLDLDVPFLLNNSRSEDSIRAAQHALENPKKRLSEEMFWFWGSQDSKKVLKLLGDNRLRDAIDFLTATISDYAPSTVARHDLLVLRHIELLKREADGQTLDKSHWSDWIKLISDWNALIATDSFWDYINQRIIALYGGIRKELIESSKKTIVEDVLRIQEDLIRFYIANDDLQMAQRHSTVLFDSKIESNQYKRILDSLLSPVETEIRTSVAKWSQDFDDTHATVKEDHMVGEFCDSVYKNLVRRLEPHLIQLNAVDFKEVSDPALAGEEYANFLHSIAFKLFKDAKLFSKAKILIKEARKFAISGVVRDKLDQELIYLDRLTLAEDLKNGAANSVIDQAKVEVGARAGASSSKKSKRLSYQVAVRGSSISVPPMCNCCLSSSVQKERVSYEYQTGNVKRSIGFDLPVCKACVSHRARLKYKYFLLIILASVAGFSGAISLMRIAPFISPSWISITAAIAAVIAYALLNELIPFAGVDESHGSSEGSVKLSTAGTHITIFEFANPLYANLFAQSKESETKPVSLWRHSRTKKFSILSKSGFLSLLISAGVLTIGLWFYWESMAHAKVYVDNAYDREIELSLGRGAKVYKIPPGLSTIEVPVAAHNAEFIDGEKRYDIKELNISSSGEWLLNPGRQNFYTIKEIKYGNASREPQDYNLGNPLLSKISADYIFTRPPKSISTKSSGEIRRVLVRSENAENINLPDALVGLKALLEKQKEALESEQKMLDETSMRIENFKKRISDIEAMGNVSGDFAAEYNALVEKANAEVTDYNYRLVKIKQMQKEFSDGVDRYNSQLQ